MKTLILYASKYGCTEKCAKMLAEKLTGDIECFNVKTTPRIDLSQYNMVIIGGSIYMGRIRKEIRKFCSEHIEELQKKTTGLFICCMQEGELAENELNDSFPQNLLSKAVAKEVFGGEMILQKMNALDRFIVKQVTKTERDMANIKEENIIRFAEIMNSIV